ncbi:MAG: glycine betaine ABC transporter substrate-binding protein [Solirubrobacteraceae bacterium]
MAALAAFMLVIAGCGEDDVGTGKGGSIPADALKGKSITVGSKEFTEQKVLGQLTIQVLKAAGANVKDQTGLAGSVAARKALTSGDIDMYWEYTGTSWLTYLKETKAIPDERKQYEAVAARDLKENKIRWLAPAPSNNTYAFAVKSESYEKLGVKKLSDFATLVAQRPGEASVCVGEEFTARDDGLPGVEKTYGFKFTKTIKIDEGLIYTETDKGSDKGGKCNFGEVFITDGRIKANDLKIIEDDKAFFPKYNPALNVREEVLKANPQLEAIFAPITAKLDNATLQDINAQVDVEGLTEDEAVQMWLEKEGFIGG